jgi:hypothetical protein
MAYSLPTVLRKLPFPLKQNRFAACFAVLMLLVWINSFVSLYIYYFFLNKIVIINLNTRVFIELDGSTFGLGSFCSCQKHQLLLRVSLKMRDNHAKYYEVVCQFFSCLLKNYKDVLDAWVSKIIVS